VHFSQEGFSFPACFAQKYLLMIEQEQKKPILLSQAI